MDHAALPDLALFRRHLGLPPGEDLDGRLAELAGETRRWYAEHGDPWSRARDLSILAIDGDDVRLEGGATLRSPVLARGFEEAGAHAVAVVAVTAGARVDAEIDRRWRSGRPDEAMFLAACAVAVVDDIRARAAAALADRHRAARVTVLPHYSPGYEGWGLADQAALFGALDDRGPLELLPSAALRPVRSTLAAFGLTRRRDVDANGFWFHRRQAGDDDGGAEGVRPSRYAFPERALARWSRERLAVSPRADGALAAAFRLDGTTCSSLGMPIALDYAVELRRTGDRGWQIASCACSPAPGDAGHRSMCAYLAGPERCMAAVAEPPAPCGGALDAALAWAPDVNPAGCLCLQANRDHKWHIVLQTIHYRLSRDRDHAADTP